jgi:hypothetical protein
MSANLSKQSLKNLQKENEPQTDRASQNRLSGAKLPSLNKASSSQLGAGLIPSAHLENPSIKQLEAVFGPQSQSGKLPSLNEEPQKRLSCEALRGKTDEELQKFIDVVYEMYRDNFQIEEVEETVEEAEASSHSGVHGKSTARPTKRMTKKVVYQPKPFNPKYPFSLQGLILQKMEEYNALSDNHLTEYLSKQRCQEILIQNGLLTDEGFIVCRPNDYLAKKELYEKIANLPDRPIRVAGRFTGKVPANPYHNSEYHDYKEKLYRSTNLHKSLVPVPVKKAEPPTKYDLMERSLAKMAEKKRHNQVKPIAPNVPAADPLDAEDQPALTSERDIQEFSASKCEATEPVDHQKGQLDDTEEFQPDFSEAQDLPEEEAQPEETAPQAVEDANLPEPEQSEHFATDFEEVPDSSRVSEQPNALEEAPQAPQDFEALQDSSEAAE